MSGEAKCCDCCRRTEAELGPGTIHIVEQCAALCRDCRVMYHGLWRVERSPVEPAVSRFLSEVRNGSWSPRANAQYAELAIRARKGANNVQSH